MNSITISDLVTDLALSGIVYFLVAHGLSLALGSIAELVWPGWIFPQPAAYDIRYHRIANLTFCLLWTSRFALRWRKHHACTWGFLGYMLGWLSPLSPKSFDTCLYCSIASNEEPATGTNYQHQHQNHFRRAHLALPLFLPVSPATTLHGEQTNQYTSNNISAQGLSPTVSSVSACEVTNEWADSGCLSDREEGDAMSVQNNL